MKSDKVIVVIILLFVTGITLAIFGSGQLVTNEGAFDAATIDMNPVTPSGTEPLIVESRLKKKKVSLEYQETIQRYQSLLEDGIIKNTEQKKYENKEVGISFQYPDIFERVDARIINGDTGRLFSGVLEFRPSHWIAFGGVTRDYTAARGGSITDTFGYVKGGEDKYKIHFVWGEQEVNPYELWDYNNGKNKALVIRNTEIGHVLSSEQLAVFINIPGSDFSGMVFVLSPVEYGENILLEAEVKILRDIISSVEFN